ncbi:ferrochelatase [Marinilabiliaceae bacterium ANBcel2]|nr:ferrochelatase [Marinilabiliaceae bacterium ANBcel2]
MSKNALLMVNLGSPDSPDKNDVKKYLQEFLMDPAVIDIAKPLRYLLVNGIIVPFRTAKSSRKYQSVWSDSGAPLIVKSRELQNSVAKKVDFPVYIAMRYGNPSIGKILSQINREKSDLRKLIVLPLYPHYARSSYGTAAGSVEKQVQRGKFSFDIDFVPPFYSDKFYIDALCFSLLRFDLSTYDHILFSYHGLPVRHILKDDVTKSHCLQTSDCCRVKSAAHKFCYRHQIYETTSLVASKLGLDDTRYSVSFQSRLGNDKWLSPFTSTVVKNLPAKGVKKLLVVAPSFVTDCLETLEELGDEAREVFIKAGGEHFDLVPSLNSDSKWVDAICSLTAQLKA